MSNIRSSSSFNLTNPYQTPFENPSSKSNTISNRTKNEDERVVACWAFVVMAKGSPEAMEFSGKKMVETCGGLGGSRFFGV